MTNSEAIDILRKLAPPRTGQKHFYDFMQARDMAIKALEKPEPQWIPCSEKLPQDEDEVLVMMADGEFMDVGWVDFYGWWHVNSDINSDTEERKDISAWQPLPEPYKEVTT